LVRSDEPSRNGSPTGFQGIAVAVPPAEFEARCIRPDDAVMRRVSPQREALRLLYSYLRSLGKGGIDRAVGFGIPTATRDTVRRQILDLTALAVSWQGVVGESDLGSVAEARLRAAHDYIAAHFGDPGLTIEKVARSQNISARYLRQLMEASGRSYISVVNELRLQKVFAALSTAGSNDCTILEVAMTAGFTDISHFNRLFRARFGDTPSGIRGKSR
jgi:AraC-like DNA-binding protein